MERASERLGSVELELAGREWGAQPSAGLGLMGRVLAREASPSGASAPRLELWLVVALRDSSVTESQAGPALELAVSELPVLGLGVSVLGEHWLRSVRP